MPSDALQILSHNPASVQKKEYLHLNETFIEINIARNFSKEEFEAIQTISRLKKWYGKASINHFKEDAKNKEERRYASLLAFYRRINLDLNTILSKTLNLDDYPYRDCPNFEKFNDIFEKYYPLFDSHNIEDTDLKNKFKNQCLRIILKLWLCGYGIIPGYTEMHITTDLLIELKELNKSSTIGIKKFVRFISFALSQEADSPVSEVIKLKECRSFLDREVDKWNSDMPDSSSSELGLELKKFAFNQLYTRTNGPLMQEYYVDGEKKRITYQKITHSTFAAYASSLRLLYKIATNKKILSIAELLNGGVTTILADARTSLDYSTFSTLKITTRFWLVWYKNQNNLSYNIERICPPEITNSDKTFGKVLDMSLVITLLSALLDDSLPFYNDISLVDYRCRYICLLMLSTGQRVSELCTLKYDCLKKNKDSTIYLEIHKTKNTEGNLVTASKDVIYYVEKLRVVAPTLKLLFSSNTYKCGDDLEVRRLVANKYNEGPLTENAVNNFLVRLQRYIFPDHTKNVFSSHDFRRIKATYMSLVGYSKQDIQKQLGQSNIDSQLPYLQTKPLSHQKHFEEILNEGVYEIDDNDDVIVDTSKIVQKTKQLISNKEKEHENLIQSILNNIKDVNNLSIPTMDINNLELTGFPVGLFSCSASAIVICSNSPIKCFNCDHYTPDIDSLDNHKIELFRYMILAKNQVNSLKKTKDIVLKSMLSEKNKYIEHSIKESFDKLFTKFNLVESDVTLIKLDLEKKLKLYSKKYLKINPLPTFMQAKNFLERGEL